MGKIEFDSRQTSLSLFARRDANRPPTDSRPARRRGEAAETKKGEHAHPDKGPHEGVLVEWGEEEYHAEFTVDHDKREATVYVLDSSATKAPATEAGKISKVTVTIANVKPPATIELTHDPKRSDVKGHRLHGQA